MAKKKEQLPRPIPSPSPPEPPHLPGLHPDGPPVPFPENL